MPAVKVVLFSFSFFVMRLKLYEGVEVRPLITIPGFFLQTFAIVTLFPDGKSTQAFSFRSL